jgi:hypothetical protein
MENKNVRTMKLIGEDFWSRPVYKCIETGMLWKDIELGQFENPTLYSCNNDFEGEPDCPIKSNLEIHFIKPEQPTEKEKFNYQLLDRLRSDCDYYLGYGNRYAKYLWAGNEAEQIEKMKELYNSFSDDKKPEWLTMDQILEYEKEMIK